MAKIVNLAGFSITPKQWVSVKELNLSYYIGETIFITMYIYKYTHHGNLI